MESTASYNEIKLVNELLGVRKEAAQFIECNYDIHKKSSESKLQKLAEKLCKIRQEASIEIQRHVKGWLIRKDLAAYKAVPSSKLITWRHQAKNVSVAGTFTEPIWSLHIPLSYCKALKLFYTGFLHTTGVPPGNYSIKFIVDGAWVCNGDLPLAKDLENNFNNLVAVKKSGRRLVRALSVRDFQAAVVNTELCQNVVSDGSPVILARSLSGSLESPRGFRVVENGIARTTLSLVLGAYKAARPKKKSAPLTPNGCADDYFINEKQSAFGVADGVGEWSTYGLDATRFSKEIIKHCQEVLENSIDKDTSQLEMCDLLEQILFEAYARTASYGSSTVLLGICRDSFLHTLCLGDSSFIVLRQRENQTSLTAVYRSQEQQHSFNCPYQLARLPKASKYKKLIEQGMGSLVSLLKRANKTMHDSPLDAETEMIPLKAGDIVIAGTDGIFDNLYDIEILRIAEQELLAHKDSQDFVTKLSYKLVERAIQMGWDATYKSPFAKNAGKAGRRYIGGKLDDTTVVVGIAV